MAESISAKTAWALARAIKGGSKKKLPNSGNATVVRVDQDGTHWVRISGSDVETPVNGAITADARPGDVVQYHLEDTRISITGNATSPSVGKEYVGERVEPVEAKVDVVARANALLNTATERARSVADAAKSVAEAVNQHFFSDTNGIHVTEATQDEWDTNHTGANVLINSIGQLFRDGLNNLLTLTTENGARALSFWDGLGNTAANITAFFGPDTSRIGYDPNSKNCATYFTNSGLQIKSRSYYSPFQLYDVAGIVATDGYVLKKTSLSIDSDWTYTLEPTPPPDTDIKVYSTISTIDRLVGTFTVGTPETISDDTVYGGTYAYDGTATIVHVHDPTHGHNGNYATFGYSMYKDANHPWLHIGHIDSKQLRAGNTISVGTGMLAQSENQAVFGRYNDNDPDNALEVGNGTDDRNRSNAFTVDWNGNLWAAGKATLSDAIEAASAAISGLLSAAKVAVTKDASDTGTDAITVNDGTSDVMTVDWSGNVECAGTISPTATASTITASSGASVTGDNACWTNGAACAFVLVFKCGSSLATNGTLTVGTLPEGYRPPYNLAVDVYTSAVAHVVGYVSTDGTVSIRNVSGSALATTTTLRVSSMWAVS